jgi:hypothetical protein
MQPSRVSVQQLHASQVELNRRPLSPAAIMRLQIEVNTQRELRCGRKATRLSRIGADQFCEDPRANGWPCGEVNVEENLEYKCDECLREDGIIW